MTSLISNALCCAGNCLCHAINNICSDTMKINPKLFSKIGFILLNLFAVGFSLIILFYGENLLKPFNEYIKCPSSDNLDCLGISSVYRMSLALVVMHGVVILFSLCGKKVGDVLNKHCWTFKLILIFGIYFAFLFVDNSFFTVYAGVSKYISLVFIIFQVLVTISFAHVINIKLVEGLDDDNHACKYQFWLLFLSFIFTGVSLYWIVTSFMNYSYNLWNVLIVCVTILLGAGFTFISISELVNRKRLLTSIYMISFVSYLCWSGLNSQPNDKKKDSDLNLSVVDIFVGLFYLVIALSYVGFYLKDSHKSRNADEREALNKNPIVEEAKLVEEDDDNDLSWSHYYFHLFMMVMSVYYCMLLTNWNVIDSSQTDPRILAASWSSFWIKISAVLISSLLYIWVLIAPRLFPDRQFDF
jgi:hypothetical protein